MAEQAPSERELEILKVLWEEGPSSVRSVYRRLAHGEDLAYNTVQTLLRGLEVKDAVAHEIEGRTFVFAPKVRGEQVTRSVTRELVDEIRRRRPDMYRRGQRLR